jgi:hypothetical protein
MVFVAGSDIDRLFVLRIFRIADGYGAIWTESFLDAEEVANIVLCLFTLRNILKAWTAVDVHPAAYKVHSCDRKLNECR